MLKLYLWRIRIRKNLDGVMISHAYGLGKWGHQFFDTKRRTSTVTDFCPGVGRPRGPMSHDASHHEKSIDIGPITWLFLVCTNAYGLGVLAIGTLGGTLRFNTSDYLTPPPRPGPAGYIPGINQKSVVPFLVVSGCVVPSPERKFFKNVFILGNHSWRAAVRIPRKRSTYAFLSHHTHFCQFNGLLA